MKRRVIHRADVCEGTNRSHFNIVRAGAIMVCTLCCVLTFFSCRVVPNADYDFLGRFPMGTPRSFVDSVKNEDPYFAYPIRVNNNDFQVDLYRMVITNVSRDFLSMIGLVPPKTFYDYVCFAYREDKLVASGTPDDLKKSTNSELASVGLALSDSLRKEYR